MTERNPAAARRVRTSILSSLRMLTSFPFAGRQQWTEGVRKLVTVKYNYLVYYIVDAEAVVILSIRHPAREREHDDG